MALWTWYDVRAAPRAASRVARQDRLAAYAALAAALVATTWQSLHPPLPSPSHAVVRITQAVAGLLGPR